MTQDDLKQYRSLCSEIIELQCRIKDHKLSDSVQGSNPEFPFQIQNHKVTGYDEEGALLKQQLREAQRQKMRIYNYINEIADSSLRQIFRYRFIDGYKWAIIAAKMGCEYSEDSTRMMVKRYIKKTS